MTTMNQIATTSFVIFIGLGLILSVPYVNAACDAQKTAAKVKACQDSLQQGKKDCGTMRTAVSCLKDAVSNCDTMKDSIAPVVKAVEKQLSEHCGGSGGGGVGAVIRFTFTSLALALLSAIYLW